MILGIAFRQINNCNVDKAKKALLFTCKCFVRACVLKIFFHAEVGIVLTLFLNFEQKSASCSYNVLIKKVYYVQIVQLLFKVII